MLPVYWHLHWDFPELLRRLPRWVGLLVYTPSSRWPRRVLVLPRTNLYLIGFLLALAGSLVLLIGHWFFRPEQRQAMGVSLAIAIAAALPGIAVIVAAAFVPVPAILNGLAVLPLPAVPFAYFYAVYRRRIAGLEVRANPLIAAYLYASLVGTAALLASLLASTWLTTPEEMALASVGLAVAAAWLAVRTYGAFRRWVERAVLGMPVAPTQLLEAYSTRITTSLTLPRLLHLLTEEMLPSLLVRQSALVRCTEGQVTVLYHVGVTVNDLPGAKDLPALVTQAGRFRPPEPVPVVCPWARLILPLELDGRTLGYWLLGRRDPDDFYAPSEITTLRALANQTAIALTNIVQAESLQALHRANIERHEAERAHLARELHDDVLNQLAALAMRFDVSGPTPELTADYQALTQHIRRIISHLRPALLDQGLGAALEELADDLLTAPPSRRSPARSSYTDHYPQAVKSTFSASCSRRLRSADTRTPASCASGALGQNGSSRWRTTGSASNSARRLIWPLS
jgi:signal transduction histidine kinase